MSDSISNAGAYVTLEDLMALRDSTRGAFSFLPRQPMGSLLAGRHSSRIRGRGLNFEELRAYLPGDDVRTIDWKVTARTRKPHVRVFTEERDRPAILVVDQRLAMFFGTRKNLQSVTAAELAAAGAWSVFHAGDRVGAVVFDDVRVHEVGPHRSRGTVMRILNLLVETNAALRADSKIAPNPAMLNRALHGVAQSVQHDNLIAIVSDFDGADEETTQIVTRLARHNDVLAVPVFDPSSTDLPSRGRIVVSDGELQVELDVGRARTRRRLIEFAGRRLAGVMAWQRDLAIPVMPVSAGKDTLAQMRNLLGRAPVVAGRQ